MPVQEGFWKWGGGSSEKITENVLRICKTLALSSGFFYSKKYSRELVVWTCLPLDEKWFPHKTQMFITIHWIDFVTNGSSSGPKLYTYRGEKDILCLFHLIFLLKWEKVSILRLLEWLQAVCWSWVSVNGFLCSWFSKLPVSVSFCLCCSGTSLPTVTLVLEGERLPTLWAGCHLNLLIWKQKDGIKSAKEQDISFNW